MSTTITKLTKSPHWNNSNSNAVEVGWIEGYIFTRISSSNVVVQYQYSNWDDIESGSDYGTANGSYIYDVTNTGTHLVGFGTQAPRSIRTQSSVSNTTATFKRLADT